MPRKILFIVHPNAGKRISESIIEIIRQEFPEYMYYQVVVWKDKDHFDEITHVLRTQDYTDAVAVGGDGTVNRVACAILGTGIRLGIVPIGSGNGLARSLGLSMSIEQSIKQIVEGRFSQIDYGTMNGRAFFCTSGVGFDAHVGNLFAASVKRGLRSYINISMREIFRYRASSYILKIDGKVMQRNAFLITVANAGQYGNDFYIAPQASMQDGLFHVVIIKPFNFFKAFGLMQRVLSRQAYMAASVETLTCKELRIERDKDGPVHFDGEPALEGNAIEFKMIARGLNVICGPKAFVAG